MTREEAQEYAKTMTYKDAVYNLMRAKSIPYRKATFIKITELLKVLEQEPKTDRIEYGTDGNPYKLSISNGKEYEQKPKIGHWIDNHHGAISCSNCHTYFCKWYVKSDAYLYMRRCPCCNAKMESEE